LVEDNRADVFLLREAIEAAGVQADLHVISDGEKAVEFINQADRDDSVSCPSLVILDLNLPRKTGCEVLQRLRLGRWAEARVLIITSSNSELDRVNAARLGANGYFRKPSTYDAYLKVGDVVKEMIEGQ
jgi:chemotaxis family two-component system response regulator Rcp1